MIMLKYNCLGNPETRARKEHFSEGIHRNISCLMATTRYPVPRTVRGDHRESGGSLPHLRDHRDNPLHVLRLRQSCRRHHRRTEITLLIQQALEMETGSLSALSLPTELVSSGGLFSFLVII